MTMEEKEWSVRFSVSASQSQVVACCGAENMDSHLPYLVTHGMAGVAGPPVLLTEYVLINLGLEGLGLMLWYHRGLANDSLLRLIGRR